MRAPHERTEGKADPSRSPAAGWKQPPASGHSMNEELHWQPMASQGPGPGATTAPADLWRGPGSPVPGLRSPGDPGVHPPGPQAPNRMALGVKGAGCGASGTPCLRPRLWGNAKTPSNPVRRATNAVPGVTPPSLLAAAPWSAPPASPDSS